MLLYSIYLTRVLFYYILVFHLLQLRKSWYSTRFIKVWEKYTLKQKEKETWSNLSTLLLDERVEEPRNFLIREILMFGFPLFSPRPKLLGSFRHHFLYLLFRLPSASYRIFSFLRLPELWVSRSSAGLRRSGSGSPLSLMGLYSPNSPHFRPFWSLPPD